MPNILIKFETKSARVKGLAFHRNRKWILASLHNGSIQLWDYSENTMIDEYSEHKGPVRGLDFHNHQPLFVSGGDDSSVRLWNYKLRRCVHTFDAHSDYVRSTFFHSTNPWILSASDDYSIRIWNWQSRSRIAILTGHHHYVMCAQFHPSKDMILSASMDQTLRLWDITHLKIKNSKMMQSKENVDASLSDIYIGGDYAVESEQAHSQGANWCAFHPSKQLCLSVGDDSFIKVWRTDPRNGLTETCTLRGHYNNVNCAIFLPKKNAILSCSDDRSLRIWDLDKRCAITTHKRDVDRFWTVAAHPTEKLYAAGHDSGVIIFKTERERPKVLADAEKSNQAIAAKMDAKRAIVSSNKKYIACINSNRITVCDGQLNVLCNITEQRKIKSAAWDDSGVLFYNTPVHVKYALADGHCTTIVSVEETLYIKGVRDNKVYCIDRNGQTKQIPVDSREFRFKQAVVKNDRNAILASLKELGKLSEAEVTFLVKNGYPGLALKFVKDASMRFPLALQAFHIEDALESAAKIDSQSCWQQLADAALQVGHIRAVERAFIELKKPYKLAMLYMMCGQKEKMREARDLARELNDHSTEFIISLLTKDLEECARILQRCGQPTLAYSCAVNHGYFDLARELSEDLSEEQLSLLPPLEDARTNQSWIKLSLDDFVPTEFENWPLLNDAQENFEAILSNESADELGSEGKGGWDDDELKSSSSSNPNGDGHSPTEPLEDEPEEGWSDDDNEFEAMDDDEVEVDRVPEIFEPPKPAKSIKQLVVENSEVALHHVLVGSFKTAFELLQEQVGAINPEPLQEIFKDLFLQSRAAYQILATFPPLYCNPTLKGFAGETPVPSGGYRIESLEKSLKDSYSLFSRGPGSFAEAIQSFRNLLLRTLFLSETSQSDDTDKKLEKMRATCREYILGLRVWLKKKDIVDDHKRTCELAAYFTKLDMSRHRSLVLKEAFKIFIARKEFQKTSAAISIAGRLLAHLNQSDPKQAKLYALADKIKSNEVDNRVQLDYDDQNPYDLCASTFTPIYKGNESISCPLCDAKYEPDFSNQVCQICQLASVLS